MEMVSEDMAYEYQPVSHSQALVAGHIYRTKRNAFWYITTAKTGIDNTWLVPIKGDPRTPEWQERANHADPRIYCQAYGIRACKPMQTVLDSIVEDITAETPAFNKPYFL